MKVVWLLGLGGPWWCQVCRDTDCLCHRSYGPISLFSSLLQLAIRRPLWPALWNIAPSVQALRGLPWLGSFSVVWYIRHIAEPPWLGSYSVDWCRHLKGLPGWGLTLSFSAVRCLMGKPLYCSAIDAGVWGEKGYGDGSTPMHDSAVLPCFHGCLAFLHQHFPP